MFQNSTRVVVKTADTLVDTLDLITINVASLKNLSLAGQQKSLLVLDASTYDVDEQRITLDAKIAKLKLKSATKPKA